MKKITVVLLLIALCVTFVFSPISTGADMLLIQPYESTYVLEIDNVTEISYKFTYAEYLLDTPNTNNAVFAYYRHFRYPADQTDFANRLDPYMDALYSNDYKISGATFSYNCHSYAWYSQNISTNHYSIPSPTIYYSDGTYYEVTTPMKGDIICYFDDAGTPNDCSDDQNLHSGIVTLVLSGITSNGLCGNANTVTVASKWGTMGLYRHNGYDCPYTDSCLTYAPNTDESDIADYVRYYRRTGHTHLHDSYVALDNDLTYHQAICDCGQIVYERHNWQRASLNSNSNASLYYIPLYVCDDCGLESPVIN